MTVGELVMAGTVAEFVQRDLEETARLKPRTRVARRCYWRRWIAGLPIGARAVADLDRAAVEEWYRSIPRPHAAVQALAMLSGAWTRAAAAGVVTGGHPCRGIRRRRLPGRERFLSEAEYERLGRALDDMPARFAAACACIRLLALTGARVDELRTAEWRDVRGHLHLRDSKTGPRIVWLPAAARRTIAALPPGAGREPLLRGPRGGRLSREALDLAWHRVRAAAGLDGVRLHDLRHSFASLGLRRRVPLPTIGRLLGHRRVETTMGYLHADPQASRQAVEAVRAVVA